MALHTAPLALHDPMDPEKLAAMLALSRQLLSDREARVAELSEAGQEIPPAAATRVRLARALVAQWRWASDRTAGRWPLPEWSTGWWGAWQHELAADTAQVAERARQRAEGGNEDAIEVAERCEVLAWYQHLDRHESRIVRMVDMMRFVPEAPAAFRKAA